MSSMRNAVQRRNHKERAQIQGREKWGILEKHKVSRYSWLCSYPLQPIPELKKSNTHF